MDTQSFTPGSGVSQTAPDFALATLRKPQFVQLFGRGLMFLAERYCPDHPEECFDVVTNGTIQAIEEGKVATIEDLPSYVRMLFRQVLLMFPEVPRKTGASGSNHRKNPGAEPVRRLQAQLQVLSPSSLRALNRFYVQQQSSVSICIEEGINLEQFDLIRQIARRAARECLGDLRIQVPRQIVPN